MSRWLAVACALQIWLLGLLAVSPDLHAALHSDAGQAEHACAVTLFSAGVENPTPAPIVLFAPVLPLEAALVPPEPLRAESVTDWLPPGRDPPAC